MMKRAFILLFLSSLTIAKVKEATDCDPPCPSEGYSCISVRKSPGVCLERADSCDLLDCGEEHRCKEPKTFPGAAFCIPKSLRKKNKKKKKKECPEGERWRKKKQECVPQTCASERACADDEVCVDKECGGKKCKAFECQPADPA